MTRNERGCDARSCVDLGQGSHYMLMHYISQEEFIEGVGHTDTGVGAHGRRHSGD